MSFVYYFGYGANRELDMMRAITGSEPVWGKLAILKGYALYIQGLNQISDPQDFGQQDSFGSRVALSAYWGNDFKSYVIKRDNNGLVAGTLWKITLQDLKWLNDWELVDLGWYHVGLAGVEVETGETYISYIQYINHEDKVLEKVDGRTYSSWAVDKSSILDLATRLRQNDAGFQ